MLKSKILIVDDEFAIRDMLRMALEISDFECREAENIQEAQKIIISDRPDLILLDWMLPGGSGLELLLRLKRSDNTASIPVIMITAKATQDNVIEGLDAGADDYMLKPFAPRELLARIRALLRRSPSKSGGPTELYQVRDLILNKESRRVLMGEKSVDLGPTEFKLLLFFMENPERAYSRTRLLDNVWGPNVYVEERTVDVHIRRLRKALQVHGQDYSDLIQTVRGTGYRFSERGLDAE